MSRSQQARQRHKQRKAKVAKKEDRAQANLAKKLLTNSKDNCLNCVFRQRSNYTIDAEGNFNYVIGANGDRWSNPYYGYGCIHKLRVMKEKKKKIIELHEDKICGFHEKLEVKYGR